MSRLFTVTFTLVQVSSLQFVLSVIYKNKGTYDERVLSVNRRTLWMLLSAYLFEIKCLIFENIRTIQNLKVHLLYSLSHDFVSVL